MPEYIKKRKGILDMDNFIFNSPTYFCFGKDTENEAGALVKMFGGSKVLIHYGGGSAVKSGLIDRVKALIPILIPLLVSSVRRAEELAKAMECRCYNGGKGRQRMKQLHLKTSDYVSFALVALLLSAVILINRFLKIGVI